MASREIRPSAAPLTTMIALIVVVWVLHAAREVLLPVALAILLSFLLAPLVDRVQRFGLRRIPAVITVTSAAFCGLAVLGWIFAAQFLRLAENLPQYRQNIISKIESLESTGGGAFGRALETIEELNAYISQKSKEAQSSAPASTSAEPAPQEEPVPVEVIGPAVTPAELMQDWVGPLLAPLGTAAIVVVLVIFALIEREELRNRLIRLIGEGRIRLTTQAMDDAGQRVSRYLLMQLLVNSCYGVAVAIGLAVIGVPNATLWGLLATALRFVPYIGPFIAAAFPIVISLAVFDGWTRTLVLIGWFVVIELITNNVLEPWLYGSSTGISTVGIILAAIFWTWLWGGIGLVMSTPLTVCFMVLGRYVPQLRFLDIMLSDQPALSPDMRFYQRLLAMDHEEASELIDESVKRMSLVELYDSIFIPALRLAEDDRHQGDLDERRQQFIYQTIREIIDDLGDQLEAGKVTALPGVQAAVVHQPAAHVNGPASILTLPARDEADELVGQMLTQLLVAQGFRAALVTAQALVSERIEQVGELDAHVVCISTLPPFAAIHARYLCKRLRPRFADLQIVVGLWSVSEDFAKSKNRLMDSGANQVVGTLADALNQLGHLAPHAAIVSAPVPESTAVSSAPLATSG